MVAGPLCPGNIEGHICVLTYVNAHSWQLYRDVPLGNKAIIMTTRYSTQSHYRDTELDQSLYYPITAERQAKK